MMRRALLVEVGKERIAYQGIISLVLDALSLNKHHAKRNVTLENRARGRGYPGTAE